MKPHSNTLDFNLFFINEFGKCVYAVLSENMI